MMYFVILFFNINVTNSSVDGVEAEYIRCRSSVAVGLQVNALRSYDCVFVVIFYQICS